MMVKVKSALEEIVSQPLKATVLVGGSILAMLWIIDALAGRFGFLDYARYVVPFLPPFFITRTAREINWKKAGHDVIKDAEPLMLISFPESATVEGLGKARPELISDSAPRHLNLAYAEILGREFLPAARLNTPEERNRIIAELLDQFEKRRIGVIAHRALLLKPHPGHEPVPYLLNSVLKHTGVKLKWQAILVECDTDCRSTMSSKPETRM